MTRRVLAALSLVVLLDVGCMPISAIPRTTHGYRQTGHRWAEGARDPRGHRVGHWVMFAADGTREAEGSYADGEMDGKWTYWFSDGESRTVHYFRGERVSEAWSLPAQ